MKVQSAVTLSEDLNEFSYEIVYKSNNILFGRYTAQTEIIIY
jgi:hypothetical protein